MIINFKYEYETKKGDAYYNRIKAKRGRIEIKELSEKRSLNQNNYQHLLFSWFGIETGYDLEYVKQNIYKQLVNPEIFRTIKTNEKTGDDYVVWRSTADLSKAETETALERFRKYGSENGIDLPLPNDHRFLDWVHNEIEKHKEYL